ncbi:DUF5994 family protein [Rhodococcus sp. WB9]|uniref:DUF5994 family protein n=1 Tax=Rhodococcus sp. WB9 TaxID=2594007 RepID=UPI001C9039BF|nr:DUF5994 family protein [Rhodococcus sp. WB9]
MTLQQDRNFPGRLHGAHTRGGPAQSPRLRLKPEAPSAGTVDGAWWPRSRDLAVEIPDLVALVAIRVGVVDRIVYDIKAWLPAPRRFMVAGRSVHLDGYEYQPLNTLYVSGVKRTRLTLLVVPPEADARYADSTMHTAANPNSALTADELLMSGIKGIRDGFDRTSSAKGRER